MTGPGKMTNKVLRVKNWNVFQHYKDRNPPWIKLATDTFQNYEFSRLQDASKLLAVCIWTLAARSKDGTVPADFAYIKSQGCLGNFVTEKNLNDLIVNGFLIDDSKSLADGNQDAIPEGEGEGETEGDISSDKSDNTPQGFASFWEVWPKTARKTAKAECLKRWVKRDLESVADKIVAHVEAMKKTETWRTGFEPAPLTYINQKRWEDDLPPRLAVVGDQFAGCI